MSRFSWFVIGFGLGALTVLGSGAGAVNDACGVPAM